MARKLPTHWLARNSKLVKTGFGIAARLGTGAMQKWNTLEGMANDLVQEKIAQDAVKALSELKGIAMKAGQIASYVDTGLPPKVREVLASLQSQAEPLDSEVLAEVIERELGASPRSVFAEWSDAPFAAASIGQVHRARTKRGDAIAVKVQYPGIEDTLDSDLSSMKAVEFLKGPLLRYQEKGVVIQELMERFKEECDYAREAASQREFQRLHSGDPRIVIPEVYEQYSSKRVLSTRFIEGRRFQEFAKVATQAEKNRAAEAIFDFSIGSIFKHGIFNADPHPGNYLFPAGDQVVFLDFGCVKRFDPDFLVKWKGLMRAALRGDRKAFDDLVVGFGFAPDPAKFDFDYHFEMVKHLYTPWWDVRPYRFTSEFVTELIERMVLRNPNKFRMNLPKDWVFVNRVQWGLFSVLAMLSAESNWRERIEPLLEE